MRIKKKDLPEVERVKLKPLFGLKPGLWLTIAYALALVLLIFFVCILPDLKNPSKRVTFTSAFDGQSVCIDGLYAGGTPFTTKVKSGSHTVEYSLDGYVLDNFEFRVSRPVFLNWLFPRNMKVESTAKMSEDAFKALTKAFFNDAVSYSSIIEYSPAVRYKPLYTMYAEAVSADGTFKDSELFNKAFELALNFITTDEMKQDAENAITLLGSSLKAEKAKQESLKLSAPLISKVPDGYLINNSFTVSKLPVSESQFKDFINENPKWAKSNRDNLVQEGLADEYYLEDFTGSEDKPVRNISYFSAVSYCEWLSGKTGKKVSLPTEEQWTLACLVSDPKYQTTLINASKSDKPLAMLGGLWELTSTYYVPGERNNREIQTFMKKMDVKADVVVKGGSYINKATDINAFTAGTSPMNLCSDYMGFRVVYN